MRARASSGLWAQALPLSVDQAFHRLEIDLVSHLAALRDPIAEIEVGQLETPAQLGLPQHVEGAEAAASHVGLEEGVDRRQSVLQAVDDADHRQTAVLPKFHEIRIDVALKQKVPVLFAAVVIHAAAGMPRGLIAQI